MFGTLSKLEGKKDNGSSQIHSKKRKFEQHDEKIEQKITKKQKQENHQKKLKDNDLIGGKFRMINEFFYTQESQKSAEHFAKNKDDFLLYHQGFQNQIKQWPDKPVDLIINQLETEDIYNNSTICDLGCGDGKIYEHFFAKKRINLESKSDKKKKGNTFQQIYSIDLVKHKDFILVSDIKHVPIKSNSVEVVIFCLALMGTNWIEFIYEANRILKQEGFIIIAEVNSRMPKKSLFIKLIKQLEFNLTQFIEPNDYFTLFVFQKLSDKNKIGNTQLDQKFLKKVNKISEEEIKDFNKASQVLLKPCLYKKR